LFNLSKKKLFKTILIYPLTKKCHYRNPKIQIMCGRYIIVQTVQKIEKRFNLAETPEDINYQPSYNVGPGKLAPVITSDKPKQLQMFEFGLTPHWSKKKMYLFNARSEGKRNQENDPNYKGAKDIITMPAFRKPIRSQRCLVIADAFYEGPALEKLSKPYLVYLKNKQRPFAFAGIWDTWKDEEGNDYNSFAIVTTVANKILQKIGHPRSPVILSPYQEQKWLNINIPLADAISMLHPYNPELMNAYPVSPSIKSPKNDSKELVEPIGQTLEPEYENKIVQSAYLKGMGSSKMRYIERKLIERENGLNKE